MPLAYIYFIHMHTHNNILVYSLYIGVGVGVGIPAMIMTVVGVILGYCLCVRYENRRMQALIVTYNTENNPYAIGGPPAEQSQGEGQEERQEAGEEEDSRPTGDIQSSGSDQDHDQHVLEDVPLFDESTD